MRVLLAITILGLNLVPLRADDVGNQTTTPIGDALDWYSVWFGSGSGTIPGTQACRGERRGNAYSFRCDPLSVVVTVIVKEGGHCPITSMRPSISSDDGLRVQTLEHLVPPSVPRKKGGTPQECGELPLKEGSFQLVITPGSRPVSGALTIAARDVALAYSKASGGRPCLLRFPNVKTGDPFFHVYVECQEVLDTIWEFRIEDGQAVDSAHWYYSRKRGFPNGFEWRRNQTDLWSGVSRPEERKVAPAR
jgi:hypothetical protein